MRALSFVPIVILLGAVLLGFTLSQTDIFNPHTRTAEASRIEAETAALVAQNEFDEQLRQIELGRIQEETNINLEARRARWAKELELMEHDAQLKSRLFELAVAASLGIVAVIGGAGAFYLLCAGIALLRQQKQPTIEVAQEGRQVIPFPGLPQRARVLTKTPATAVALLLLGVAVFTASAALL